MTTTRPGVRAIAIALCWFTTAGAHGFSTMTSAQAQSCGGTQNMSDGAVGQVTASSIAASSGMCGDGRSSSATTNAFADIAGATIVVSGTGTGDQDINGVFAQASFGECLTIENVPAGIDDIDLLIQLDFLGTPPAAAFFNSASFTGIVNAQVAPGDVRLEGCSGDLCLVPDPVANASLGEVI